MRRTPIEMHVLKILDEWIKLHGESGESSFKSEGVRIRSTKKESCKGATEKVNLALKDPSEV